MRFGLPYQGSKNRLAERIIALLPKATHLYDVFAGGCAVTHCALLSRKWQCVHFSDVTNSVELFRDCIEGNIPDGSEWISREDFFARKDAEPYVRLLWSFSNNQREYLYGKDIEAYKKAVHEMIFAPTPNERRLKFKEVCRLMPSVLANNGGGGRIEYVERLQRLHTAFSTLNRNYPPPPYTAVSQSVAQLTAQRGLPTATSNIELDRLQHEERRRACQELPFLGGEYEMRIADYRDIEILPDSVIYCDPPYANTAGYETRTDTFDHDAFYDWAEAQEVPVFISEYWMPEDRFKCLAEWPRTSSFCATNNGLRKIEKLYVPNKWYDKYRPTEQKTLFDI